MAKIILCNSDETGFLSDCPSLMLGIAIRCIQHSQGMLEREVCELTHSFFHFCSNNISIILKVKLFAYCIDQNFFNLECYFIIYSNQLPFHKVLLQGAILFVGMKSQDCMFLYSMGYWLNPQMIQFPIYKPWRGIQESRPDSTQAVRISMTFCGIAITTIWLSRALSSEVIYPNLWRGYKGHGTRLKHVNRYFNVQHVINVCARSIDVSFF